MQMDAKWMLLLGRQFVICVDSSEQINQRYQAVKNHHDVGPDASCKMASNLRINVLGRSRLRLSRDLRKLRQKTAPHTPHVTSLPPHHFPSPFHFFIDVYFRHVLSLFGCRLLQKRHISAHDSNALEHLMLLHTPAVCPNHI